MTVARQAKLWQWAAAVYVVAASVFFAFMPILALPTASGPQWVAPFRVLGWAVFLPLLIPLALTVIPLAVRTRRVLVAWICTGVLGALCLFLALSSGLLFVPAPLIAAVGAYLTSRAPVEDTEVEDTPWQVPDA